MDTPILEMTKTYNETIIVSPNGLMALAGRRRELVAGPFPPLGWGSGGCCGERRLVVVVGWCWWWWWWYSG